MRELEDEEKVDLKGKRWHFNRNEENLSKQAKEELENCCHLYQELVRRYIIRLVVVLSRMHRLCTTFLSTDLHFVLAKFCFASAGS